MITCRDAAELVTEYLEGSLSPGRRLKIWFHLLMCKNCRVHVAKMRTMIDSLGRIPPDTDVPPEFLERLTAVLPQP